MKILIPEFILTRGKEHIKNIAPIAEIAILKIVKKKDIMRRVLRKIAEVICPYGLYKKMSWLIGHKRKFTLFVNDQILSKPLRGIDVLLVTWDVHRDIFITLLDYLPDLKWIHSTVTGIEHLKDDRLKEKNILLTSSKGIHSKRIAEFTLALILHFAKRISEHRACQKKHVWKQFESIEIEGKTLGILGMGNIGKEIASKARMLGMNIIGYDYFQSASLQELLQVSDFIVICLPLTNETRNVIGMKEFLKMKRSSFLINIAREQLVDEESMVTALKSKLIAGAAIDVIRDDYLPKNHPFNRLDNVIITHHSAFSSDTAWDEMLERFLSNCKLYRENKQMLGEIDKTKWF